MNDPDHAVYQALQRVSRFGANHAATFPATGKAAADFARVPALVIEIGPVDSRPGIPASPATGAKASLFDEVWEDLKAISGTARTIARDEPGFSADFRLGDDTQRDILATATSFLGHLQDPATVAKFVAYELPADFVTDLAADLDAITGKSGEQADDQMGATGDTARVATLVAEGRDILARLNTAVRNRFRKDPAVLAEWRAASRLRRRGEPRGDEETPPEPPVA